MIARLAIAIGAWALVGTAQAADTPDPAKANQALVPLLRSADRAIPRSSSCFGDYGQSGKPRLGHLLASRLAYLHNGQNVISGSCEGKHCKVEIRHAAGEDVASATISFTVAGGLVQTGSLGCVLTP